MKDEDVALTPQESKKSVAVNQNEEAPQAQESKKS